MSAAIEALRRRARAGLLASILLEPAVIDKADHWRGYLMALRDLERGAGDMQAAKDAALPYEPPGVIGSAAAHLPLHVEELSRFEIFQRLAHAGFDITANHLADTEVGIADQQEHGVVPVAGLHDGKAPVPGVVHGDDSVHPGSVPGAAA